MKPSQIRVLVAICAFVVSGLVEVSVAQAQAVPPQQMPDVLLEQQRKAEEQQKKQEELVQPKTPPEIDKPARSRAPKAKGAEAKVTVTQFKFSGNTVVTTQELEKIVAPSLGQTLTLRELTEVAGLISEHYAAQGYILAQAYLPPQEIREGVVEIAILEGKVGNIGVTGNQRYTTSTILRAMEPVRERGIIHEATLETALNELNDYPGLKVQAALKPGEARGLTDLELLARERIPYTFTADINNYGSNLTGPWIYSGEIGLGNLAGRGDNLTLKGSKSDDNLFYTNIGYLIPLTSFGTKLQLTWVHTENVIGGQFATLRPTGRADIASVDILQTITRTGALSLTGVFGFDFKTVRNLLGQSGPTPGPSPVLFSKDELRIFRLGVKGDYRDSFLGRTYFGVTVHEGVPFLGGSEQNAPQTSFVVTDATGNIQGAGPGYWTKLTADVARFQSLGLPFIQNVPVLPMVLNDSYLILRATGQLASDRLLSPERFAIGGYYTVRGYPVAQLIGDNGYAATAEMVVPIPSATKVPFSTLTFKEMFQVAMFIDQAGTFATPLSIPQGGYGYLTSAGAGLRVNIPFGVPEPVERGVLTLRIDWASAIGRPRPISHDQGLTIHPITDAGILYVSAVLRF
ncbi:MAG TPA: ShlB/FhaC/HecB family hemolysin secretion/activation protein [Nitrospirales bacterium]|jgi:hemolysin activation/secretion protein|nr:ShlB/FhaC/HecB family hemolysin secretion/activation protein [Nitrospirales bacterium]